MLSGAEQPESLNIVILDDSMDGGTPERIRSSLKLELICEKARISGSILIIWSLR